MTAAAGLATPEVLDAEPVYETIEAEGSLLYTHFDPDGPLRDLGDLKEGTDRAAGREFDRRLFEQGFYFLPGHIGAISYRTTEGQLDAFLDAAEAVAREMQDDGLL